MPGNKQLLLIVSKTSGSQEDILPALKKVLAKSTVTYDYKQVATPPELAKLLKSEAGKYQAVAVYGGDGSVIAAAKALVRTVTKLIILPGGTANIIAKGLNIPSDPAEALALYTEARYQNGHFDIAVADSELFAFDMHAGWWADAISTTPRKLKKRFGQLAYGMSALKQLPKHEKDQYEVYLDGRRRKFKAHTVMIANHGFQNFLNVPLFSHRHRYGTVQMAIIKTLKPWRLIFWLIGKALFKRNIGNAVRTYTAAEIKIKQSPTEYMFDDTKRKFKLPFTIAGGEEEVRVVVPPREKAAFISKLFVKIRLWYLRIVERFRNYRMGTPRYEYSRIAPHVYLGGTYRQSAYEQFKEWNVTGIVNMRKAEALPAPKGFKILQLKTQDWHAPPLEILKQGVDFIEQQIANGGGAYVHCRQGEGRGPTMAAAYLISKGLTVDEALTHIQLCRPVSHPNRSQVKRLAEWQDTIAKNS